MKCPKCGEEGDYGKLCSRCGQLLTKGHFVMRSGLKEMNVYDCADCKLQRHTSKVFRRLDRKLGIRG